MMPRKVTLALVAAAIVQATAAEAWCPQRTPNPLAIACGGEHTCAIADRTYRMHCFGDNSHEQSTPPAGVTAWSVVSAGWSHTCGIELGTKKMHCFGATSSGQTTPPAVVTAWSVVSAGRSHTCGIELGTNKMHCFGSNDDGQNTPPAGVTAWSAVSVGRYHTCGIELGTNKMHCFGNNDDGQTTLPAGVTAWSAVSAGERHTCGIEDGTSRLFCFGVDYIGQSTPPANVTAWSAVAAGKEHTCGIEKGTATMHCFGADYFGESTPPANVTAWSTVSAGNTHSCGIELGTNKMHCFGDVGNGQTTPPAGVTAWGIYGCNASLPNASLIQADDAIIELDLTSSTFSVWPHASPPLLQGWASLRSVLMPSTLSNIAAGMLEGAPRLTTLDFRRSTSLTTIPQYALGTDNGTLTTLHWPSSVTTIEGEAFLSRDGTTGNADMTALDLSGTSVSTLPTGALSGLSGLSSVSLPSSLSSMETSAFHSATPGISALDLSGTSLSTLPTGALSGLSGLSSVSLPSSLSSIVPGMLTGSHVLHTLDLSRATSLTTIPQYALGTDNGTLTTLHWPSSVTTIEGEAFLSRDGTTGNADMTALDLSGTSVSTLPSGALSGLSGLSTVSLPSSLSSMEASAFHSTTPGISALDLSGTSVSTLPSGALSGLSGLSSVSLPSSLSSIAAGAFQHSLQSGAAVTLSSPGLTTINAQAFSNVSQIQSLHWTIPALALAPSGLLAPFGSALKSLTLHTSAAFTSDASPCGLFDGLTGLESLTIIAPGSSRVFGQDRDLSVDGFASCSFRDSLQALHLEGLDLGRSDWTQATFSSLTSLRTLTITKSQGSRSFQIASDVLSGLPSLMTLDLSSNGIDVVPQLSRAALESLTRIDLSGGNPLDRVDERAFANLFQLTSVAIDLGKACAPGTVKTPITVIKGEDVAMCRYCPKGQFCPDGLVSNACPKGTYNPSFLGTNESACKPCPPGTTTAGHGTESAGECIAITLSCPPGTAGINCDPCPAGQVSAGGNVLQCTPCKPGTVSQRSTTSQRCLPCPVGSHMPLQGSALLESCKPCGSGLTSDEGSASCSGCPAGSFLDRATKTCTASMPESCTAEGRVCLPGVPEAVPAPTQMRQALDTIPLPSATQASASSPSPASQSQSARRLRPALQAVHEQQQHHSHPSRRLQQDTTSGSATPTSLEAQSAMLQTIVWIVGSAIVGIVVLLLFVPAARPSVQCLLKSMDGNAMAHAPPEFSAVRRVRTPLGGFFTIAAVFAALSLSSNLVIGYALDNTSRTDGLQVAAEGFTGTQRARAAASDAVLDVVIRPASFISCSSAFRSLSVTTAGAVRGEWTPSQSSSEHAAAGSLLELSASARVTKLAGDADASDWSSATDGGGGGGAVCWLRATCSSCTLSQDASVQVVAHWSAQVVVWRLATLDAEGLWASTKGVAASPVALLLDSGSSGNTTAAASTSADQMLSVQRESVALVGHVLDDTSVTPGKQVDAFIPQDLATRSTETRSIGTVDPESSVTTMQLSVRPSTVFATTKLTTVYTFVQLVSAIVGVVIGIMGGFTAAFAIVERTAGSRLECLCSRSGLVETEGEAMRLANEQAIVRTSKRAWGRDVGSQPSLIPEDSAIASASSASGTAAKAIPATNNPMVKDNKAAPPPRKVRSGNRS